MTQLDEYIAARDLEEELQTLPRKLDPKFLDSLQTNPERLGFS